MTPGVVVGGKYRLVRLLGQGAMGEVWAAVNELTGGEVALKLLSRPREELRHRLLREARACGKLRHRHIIDVHDVGETSEGEPFLVMALLHGETLAELLERKRRLEPELAAQIARDMARALSAAHKAGIVHRDLKPANVFLHREEGGEDTVVKVLDFGVSKDLEHDDGLSTVAGATVGSPAYMSPEQARSAADLDGRTDLWSVGVVLFEMLTGKRPFEGDAHQVLARISFGPIPLVSHCVRSVDPALAAVVGRCLERDRARRFGSAEELAAALEFFARPSLPELRPRAPSLDWEQDEDDAMPTLRFDRNTVREWVKSATVSPPGADTDAPIDAGAMTLPDVMESAPSAPRFARTLPLGTYSSPVPRAPRFNAPPLVDSAPPPPSSAPEQRHPSTRPRSSEGVLSSMAPVVHPAAAPAGHTAALVAVCGAILVLLGMLAVRTIQARSSGLPAPAAAPEVGASPIVEEAPAPAAPLDSPPPEPTVTPAETAAPAPPAPEAPKTTPKPSRKKDSAKSNAPSLQKAVRANPRGI